MRILLTNDDGVSAPGLKALVGQLTQWADVVVYAPEREQSCSGHSITLHKPLRIHEAKMDGMPQAAYSVSGTPADCVVLGLLHHARELDLHIAGVNPGANLGEEVFYSGTVAAAMEAAINGLPSIAVSVAAPADWLFGPAAEYAAHLGRNFAGLELPGEVFLNVNVPNVPSEEIQGIRITRLGRRDYQNYIEERHDPRGQPYYWFDGEAAETDSGENTDIGAVNANFISVTPMRFDLTDHSAIQHLRQALSDLALPQS